jgi:mannose-1-phosphate guanylyltransferase
MKIVILAGGIGKRLWPMSSKQKPKQFQNLVSEKSLIQQTVDRVSFADPKDIYISTNAEYVDLVKEQCPEIPTQHIIGEPSIQDTAPCMGLAAALIARTEPNAVVAMVSADHLIQNPEVLQKRLQAAEELALRDNTLNIVEVTAKSPKTELGYVEVGAELEPGVFELKGFKEKPDLKTAQGFIQAGNYLWNTGFYVWKASRILEAFQKHAPQTYTQLKAIQEGGDINEHYPKCEKLSIDYAIMEKVDPSEVRILPAENMGWSDIGTWASIHEELAESPTANVEKGKVVSLECEGSLIYNETNGTLATFGLKDLIVVQTEGKTLICPKDRSADLKLLLEKLNEH